MADLCDGAAQVDHEAAVASCIVADRISGNIRHNPFDQVMSATALKPFAGITSVNE